jgi:hypothetical protein
MPSQRFQFIATDPALPDASLLPMLPLVLSHAERNLSVAALLDTGATVNVLPYQVGVDLGVDLGAVWDEQTTLVRLSGNLAQLEARVLIATAVVQPFKPVRLAFAWTRADDIPVILGQVNFFLEFDVCFFRAQRFFEVTRKTEISQR